MNDKTVKELMAICSAVLLDINGTTTVIGITKNDLYINPQTNAERYLDETWDDDETKDIINDLYLEYLKENDENNVNCDSKLDKLPIVVKFIETLIKSNQELPAVRKLQGLILNKAYEKHDIISHVYEDVQVMLKRCLEKKLPVYIYSSESIAAQKLLFKHSVDGDLLKYISGHFDTSIGSKVDRASYDKIAKSLDIPPQSIVCIADVPEEAEKARIAQLNVIISKRAGTVMHGKEVREYPFISYFDELFDASAPIKD